MPLASALDFLLLAAIWGASFLFMRYAVVDFGFVATAAVRVGIASLFLLPLLVLRGQWPELRRHWKVILPLGVLNAGVPFLLFSYALLAITTGLSAILNATVPLFGALIGWLWLKDRPSGSRMVGLVIGFAGVAMLAWGKASFKPAASGVAPAWAVLACIVASVSYGFSANAAKRYLAGVPSLTMATGSQVGATLGLALPAWWLWPAQAPGIQAWSAAVVVGVLCTGIAFILFFRLIDQVGPARAVAVTFVLPVFAIFYGAVFLGEEVTSWMLVCGVVIVAGTALATGVLKLPAPRTGKA